jgi:RNA polymerase sigma-70 factor (ECF subfamily)
MDEKDWLAERFEEQRTHLRAVAYRMLGSLAEADDAVQDAWVRVSRADVNKIENLGGWLTTIVARVCLNMLRSRKVRREKSMEFHLPDPVISPASELGPEEEVLLADSVGLALLVVLDALAPAERLAFVLHDMFDLPFEEIAPMVGRSPAATRQLASRARRRVKGSVIPDPDLARQQAVVDAFFRQPAAVTWTRWSPCSTPMSSCTPIWARAARLRPWWSAAQRPWPGRRGWAPIQRHSSIRH